MNIKSILLFIGGVTVGGVTGILGTKKYYQNKYQKQYDKDHDALEEYYHQVDEYSRGTSKNDEESDSEECDTEPSRVRGVMSSEERAKIREKLNKNWEETTNYAGMYKVKEKKVSDTLTNVIEEERPENEETLVEESPEEQAFDDYQNNKNKPPRIISEEAYSELPSYIDHEVLYFHSYDETLCDENDEIIEEPERLIGDALTKYNFIDSDERLIFVMNHSLSTCYEIQKLDSSYGDSH